MTFCDLFFPISFSPHQIFSFVQSQLRTSLGAQSYLAGSSALKTYIPGEDINITACLCKGQEGNWFLKFTQGLCSASTSTELPSTEFPFIIRGVYFANACVRSVRTVVEMVDDTKLTESICVKANRPEDLCNAPFLEEVDRVVGQNHLFKRSIVLIKAWCSHESQRYSGHPVSVVSSARGMEAISSLSSRAIESMVLCMFNFILPKGGINHPFAALVFFLKFYANFEWDNCIISVEGPRRYNGVRIVPECAETFLSSDFLEENRRAYAAVASNEFSYCSIFSPSLLYPYFPPFLFYSLPFTFLFFSFLL